MVAFFVSSKWLCFSTVWQLKVQTWPWFPRSSMLGVRFLNGLLGFGARLTNLMLTILIQDAANLVIECPSEMKLVCGNLAVHRPHHSLLIPTSSLCFY